MTSTSASRDPGRIDKTGWAPGPWHDEPDHLDFVAHGLECKIIRHPTSGHLCGYVACDHRIPEQLLPEHITGGGHPTYGFDCGHVSNFMPGSPSPLGDPVAYCTFDEICQRTTTLAKALETEAVWWRRCRRQIARVLQIRLRNWPRHHA